ncbi:MAG: DUF1330 domain-containing protein [Actinomycetota bacterium]
MTAYSVLEVTPTDDAWIPGYLAPVAEIISKHGGKYLARTTTHERAEGEGPDVALRVLLEWPSMDAARAFVNDPEYAPHLAARTNGSISHHVIIDGVDDMA